MTECTGEVDSTHLSRSYESQNLDLDRPIRLRGDEVVRCEGEME